MDKSCVFGLAVICVTVTVVVGQQPCGSDTASYRDTSISPAAVPTYSVNTTTTTTNAVLSEQSYYRADPRSNAVSTSNSTTVEPTYYREDPITTAVSDSKRTTTEPPYYRTDPTSTAVSASNRTTTEPEYYRVDPILTAVLASNMTTTEPEYYRVDPISTAVSASNRTTTEPSYYQVDPISTAVSANNRTTTEPEYYRVDPISTAVSASNRTTTEPSYYQVDPISTAVSANNRTTTEPEYYRVDPISTAVSASNRTTTEPSYYQVDPISTAVSANNRTTTKPEYYRVDPISTAVPASNRTTTEPSYYRVDPISIVASPSKRPPYYRTDPISTVASASDKTTTKQTYFRIDPSYTAPPVIMWFQTGSSVHRTKPSRPAAPPAEPPLYRNTSTGLTAKKSCVLPQYPQYGSYYPPICRYNDSCELPQHPQDDSNPPPACSTHCAALPGAEVPENWVLLYTCHRGYQLDDGNESTHIYCVNGNWKPRVPKCRELCGKMDSCLADTGAVPWVVFLSQKPTGPEYCLGTLISPHIVLTSAFCVVDIKTLAMTAPSDVTVTIGKQNRNWTDDGPHVMKVKVRAISVPPRYAGIYTVLSHSLALLDLDKSVNVTPACIDWDHEITTTPGDIGKLTGFRNILNGSHFSRASTFSAKQMTYIEFKQCLSELRMWEQLLVPPDTFCAVNRRDSYDAYTGYDGVSLTFDNNGLQYAMGVVSTFTYDKQNKSRLIFTNVTNCELLRWIVDTKREFDGYHLNLATENLINDN